MVLCENRAAWPDLGNAELNKHKEISSRSSQPVQCAHVHLPEGPVMGRISQTYLTQNDF